MKFNYLMSIALISSVAYATNIDVYGVRKDIAHHILKYYGESIRQVELDRMSKKLKHQSTFVEEKKLNQLLGELKKKYNYSQISIDTVYYPDKHQSFTTINICDSKFTHGLLKGEKEAAYSIPYQPDIIDRMIVFIDKAVEHMVSHPGVVTRFVCKDLQCITPDNKYFFKDLDFFRKHVPLQMTFIQRSIFTDPILKRRRAAIFLLAYCKDTQQVARLLEKCLDDNNSYIRHDALRVFGEMYLRHPELKVPIEKVIRSSYSCDEAERNKALIFLNELAVNSKYHSFLVKQREHFQLLQQLIQPNNHLYAKQILMKIS